MRLSDPARRLPGMQWWGWALAGAAWCGTATGAAVIIGRVVRRADRQRYVPQLDDPIRRSTDLDHTATMRHGLGMPEWAAQHVDRILADDGLPSWDPEPPRGVWTPGQSAWQDDSGTTLFGATQMLASAANETTARYWLAVCARRGATWEQQRDLWDEWTRLHDSTVIRLDTYREDTP